MRRSRPPVALYIHIPFCVSLCPYCDFVVYAGAAARGPKARVGAFVAALHAELDLRADALDASFGGDRPALETVYLGGGTPSLLPAGEIAGLLEHVGRRYGIAPGAEVTLEANPGPDERGDAAALRAAGVTRLSIGAQAMSASGLRRLGRRHRVVDVVRAVAEARQGGIASVSLDLLYDAPDATLIDWIETLEAALALEPDHLSLYALTLDDPDAEGLTGPGGDHLPTTTGARRWRAVARPTPGRGPRRCRVPPRGPPAGRRRLARLRDQQLGAARTREPAQPRLLGASAVRSGRAGRARLRRRHAALERGPPRRLSRCAHPGRRGSGEPPARRLGGHRPGDRGRRRGHPRPAHRPRCPAHRHRGRRPSTRPSVGRWQPNSSMSSPTIGSC